MSHEIHIFPHNISNDIVSHEVKTDGDRMCLSIVFSYKVSDLDRDYLPLCIEDSMVGQAAEFLSTLRREIFHNTEIHCLLGMLKHRRTKMEKCGIFDEGD